MSAFRPLTPEQSAAERAEMQASIAEFERQLAKHPEALAALNRLIAEKAPSK